MLTAPVSSVKPPRWNVSPAFVAPEWRWIYRSAFLMWPMFAGDGVTARDLIRRFPAAGVGAAAGANVRPGRRGWVYAMDPIATDNRGPRLYTDTGNPPGSPTAATRWSFVTAGHFTTIENLTTLFGLTDTAHNQALHGGITGRGAKVRGSANANGTITADISLTLPGWYTFAATYDGATLTCYAVDEQGRMSTASNTGTFTTNFATKVLAFGHGSTDARQVDGEYSYFLIGLEAYTAEQIHRLARDPFGPFRMGRRRVAAAPSIDNDQLALMGFAASAGGRLPWMW